MKNVSVRGYSRRAPRRRNNRPEPQNAQSKLQGCLALALLIVVALVLLAWLISRIPPWVLILFALVILALAAVFLVAVVRYRQQSQQIVLTRVSQSPQPRRQPAPAPRSDYEQFQDERRHKERMASLKTVGDVLSLTPSEFEEFCGKLLELLGYTNVVVIGRPGDLGVDVSATDPTGKSTIVQCKKFGPGRKVNSGDFQKFLGAMMHHHAEKGIYVTTSNFSQPVLSIAKSYPQIHLLGGERLAHLIHQTASMWN